MSGTPRAASSATPQPPGTQGCEASVYLGSSAQASGRQLKWANDAGARWAVIYGNAEEEAGTVTVRDMTTGEQASVPAGDLAAHFAELAARAAAG